MPDKLSTNDLLYIKESKTFVVESSELRNKLFTTKPGIITVKHGSASRAIKKVIYQIDVHNPNTGKKVKFYEAEEVRDAEYELQYTVFKTDDPNLEGVTLKVFND
jgi:hypothetical protein